MSYVNLKHLNVAFTNPSLQKKTVGLYKPIIVPYLLHNITEVDHLNSRGGGGDSNHYYCTVWVQDCETYPYLRMIIASNQTHRCVHLKYNRPIRVCNRSLKVRDQ